MATKTKETPNRKMRRGRAWKTERAWTDAELQLSEQERLEIAVRNCADGLVYFVQMGDCGPIKIGRTSRDNLKQRLAALRTYSPWALHLRRTFPGTPAFEERLHHYFDAFRLEGEWFWPDPFLASVAHGNAFYG
jgi:hypothetical protein